MSALLFALLFSTAHAQSIHPNIVGGAKAAPNEFPYIASLQDKEGHFCGGSLIRKNWVLTAAHCATPDSTIDRVVLGMYDRRDMRHVEIDHVKKIFVHPGYSDKTTDWDFALLKLKTNSAYPTIDLNDEEIPVHAGDNILTTIAGWGVTKETRIELPNVLRKVQLPLITKELCEKIYPDQITDRMICAGVDKGGKDSCQGDSGGPMIIEDFGRPLQIGIVSWGDGCARPHTFGVYSKVSAAIEWINSTIQSSEMISD